MQEFKRKTGKDISGNPRAVRRCMPSQASCLPLPALLPESQPSFACCTVAAENDGWKGGTVDA